MKPQEPLYKLAYGIEVIGEYPARGKNLYVRLRIRPHPFFPNAPQTSNGILVRKNRVILSIKLGRALFQNEHAHHIDEDMTNDAPGNIELLTASEHNKRHKIGSNHSLDSKNKIRESMKKAYSDGRHPRMPITDQKGELNNFAKLTLNNVYEIRSSKEKRKVLAKLYGVTIESIRNVQNRVTWK